ncbi:MAG: putative dihydroneopterin aldolase FolB [Pseudomonadota bacterium]
MAGRTGPHPAPCPAPALAPSPVPLTMAFVSAARPASESGPMTAVSPALDLILIEGLRLETVIGIHVSELHVPQPLVIDVVAGLPRARACDTDQIADTIDYGVLRERLLRLAAEHRIQLLEAFAEAICDITIGEFGAAWVRVKVVKPQKFPDLAAVGVQIEREAAPRAGTATPHGATPVLSLIGAGMVPERR